MPEKECPTSTVGPSCRASTRSAEATASGSVVRGFCTAVALRPAVCNRAITSDQHDPSANKPCTRTTLRAFAGAGVAATPRTETSEAAAPATRVAEKVRLFIIIVCLPLTVRGCGEIFLHRGARLQMLASSPSLKAGPSCRCKPIALTVLDKLARPEPVHRTNIEQVDGSVHLEDDSKPRRATHHPVVRRLSLPKRKDLIRRTDAVKLAEGECVLGIDGDSRIPAFHRRTLYKQVSKRIDAEGADCAEHHHRSIRSQAPHNRLHRVGIRHRCDDCFSTPSCLQGFGNVAVFAVDVVMCAENPGDCLLVPSSIHRHRSEAEA